jgi:hypothetical protein
MFTRKKGRTETDSDPPVETVASPPATAVANPEADGGDRVIL